MKSTSIEGDRTIDTKSIIDQLNSFLRGEISAVETYRQAFERAKTLLALTELKQSQRSHEERVEKLRARIFSLGGEAATQSGAWGAFAKLVEGSAALFGERAAVAALEEGEDHGLRDYRAGLDALDSETRYFIETEILAEQERTHAMLSALKKQLARAHAETRSIP